MVSDFVSKRLVCLANILLRADGTSYDVDYTRGGAVHSFRDLEGLRDVAVLLMAQRFVRYHTGGGHTVVSAM